MLKVFQERDRVILDLCGRLKDVSFNWKIGETLVATLRDRASDAEAWRSANRTTICTKMWGLRVESYDGQVFMRFRPPESGLTRVPLTPEAARTLADKIEFRLQQAAYKMRFEFAK